jgi:hypothetical protein
VKPQCVRKACNLPAPPQSLTASCHLTHVQKQPCSNRKGSSHYAATSRPLSRSPDTAFVALIGSIPSRISLVQNRETWMARPRNFDIVRLSPILLRVIIRPSLGKPRQYAHRRRFAHPPRFQNRAGLKIVGAASPLRNTRCSGSRNRFDLAAVASREPSGDASLHVKKASF